MERNEKRGAGFRRMILRLPIIMALMLSIGTTDAKAQKITYLNDKAKTYQLRSMETGKWEFHPGLYYVTLHKSYSGGYWKGLNIRWDVKKSSVGQVEPVRASEILLEASASKDIQLQIDSIKPLMLEETARSAERMVDAIYIQYESKFKEAFACIDELTTIINEKSGGSLLEKAIEIIDEKELLQAEIDYIHETGPTKQMEQAKRQLAYEEILRKLESLCDYSYKLAYYSQTFKNLKDNGINTKSYTSRNGARGY